jgi:hypothetical protein
MLTGTNSGPVHPYSTSGSTVFAVDDLQKAKDSQFGHSLKG